MDLLLHALEKPGVVPPADRVPRGTGVRQPDFVYQNFKSCMVPAVQQQPQQQQQQQQPRMPPQNPRTRAPLYSAPVRQPDFVYKSFPYPGHHAFPRSATAYAPATPQAPPGGWGAKPDFVYANGSLPPYQPQQGHYQYPVPTGPNEATAFMSTVLAAKRAAPSASAASAGNAASTAGPSAAKRARTTPPTALPQPPPAPALDLNKTGAAGATPADDPSSSSSPSSASTSLSVKAPHPVNLVKVGGASSASSSTPPPAFQLDPAVPGNSHERSFHEALRVMQQIHSRQTQQLLQQQQQHKQALLAGLLGAALPAPYIEAPHATHTGFRQAPDPAYGDSRSRTSSEGNSDRLSAPSSAGTDEGDDAAADKLKDGKGAVDTRNPEQRRREQRRLSAQRRRERKRSKLSDLESAVRQAQHVDAEMRQQLATVLSNLATRDGLADASNSPRARAIVEACDPNVLYPVFPDWEQMLRQARVQAAREVQEEEKKQPRRRATPGTDGAPPNDKLAIRRERNRISARMSRLRKRLRQDYLSQMIALLKARTSLLKTTVDRATAAMNERP